MDDAFAWFVACARACAIYGFIEPVLQVARKDVLVACHFNLSMPGLT